MTRKLLMPGFIAFTALLFACDRVAGHDEDEAVDIEAIAAAIGKQEAEVLAAFKARDGARVASFYAEDSVMATPGRAPAKGKAAIAAMVAEDFKDPAFTLDFASEKIAVAAAGDMAYSRGSFRVSYTNPATKMAESANGRYVTIFRRDGDGWKVAEDFSTPSIPIPTPAPAG